MNKETELYIDLLNQYGCVNVTSDTESESVKYLVDNNLARLIKAGGPCVGFSDVLIEINAGGE